ncbi:hypothetical protein AB0469_35450 [Streptomyces sp. NPDC093801]|uniref:hypothetical protein n=1 Tax=Streptomyces sp. NPDC093801 TaxID=3155203 RepID=UPI00344F0A65
MTGRQRLEPLPAAAAHQPPARRRRTLTLDIPVWKSASASAKGEHLTGARVLEVLLLSYGSGHITLGPALAEETADHDKVGVSLADNAVARAETRRGQDHTASSLSELARRLLAGYTRGTITVTLTANGHA